jgi:hypothetical protein
MFCIRIFLSICSVVRTEVELKKMLEVGISIMTGVTNTRKWKVSQVIQALKATRA